MSDDRTKDHPRELLGEDRWEDLLDTAATAIADRFDAERYSHRDGIERCEYGCALTLAYQGSEDLAELMLRAVLPGLLAQAWDEGARSASQCASPTGRCARDGWDCDHSNPYRQGNNRG